jgi:PleD family two-component response regulator
MRHRLDALESLSPFHNAQTPKAGGMNESGQTGEVRLVDDDPSVLRSMQYLLASDGLAVHAFNKLEDFLADVAAYHVSVVVLDIWMER